MLKKLLFVFFSMLLLASCASNEKLIYMQGAESGTTELSEYQNTLQPDDKLMITVTSEEPELANDYNMLYVFTMSTQLQGAVNDDSVYTYLIDQEGNIEFPELGKIYLAGLTRIEAEAKIKKLISLYIKNPGVNIRVLNFKVSVLGEVAAPGPQRVIGERMTIFEALSAAGDLTIYGKRKDILLIREKDGKRMMTEIDITNPDIVNSEYYYLAHNDVLYVKPNKTKVNSSAVGPNLTIAISALSLLVTIIALSTR